MLSKKNLHFFLLNALAAVLRFVCQSSKFTTAQLLVSKKLRLEKYRLSNCDLFSTLSIQPMVKPRGKLRLNSIITIL